MAHRLSKITTRTGDAGQTGLGDGSRVPKNHPRVRALGDIDELNSAVGLILAEDVAPEIAQVLSDVQHDLLDLGGEVSIPGHAMLGDAHIGRLESASEEWNAALAPLKEFILPGGTRAAAAAHVARTVCRRAERDTVALQRAEGGVEAELRYLNRLSDALFVWARWASRLTGRPETLWEPNKA